MTNWESLTVAQLKEECKSRGLSVGGKKADLVARLEEQTIPNDVLDAEIADDTSPPNACLLYTSPSPRDRQKSRMPSSA